MSRQAPAACGTCAHFRNDAAYLEDALEGLTSFSSADACSRAEDGICTHHQRHRSAGFWCGDFEAIGDQVLN